LKIYSLIPVHLQKLLFLDTAEGFHQFYSHNGQRQLKVERVLSKHNLICLKLSQLVHQRAMVLDCCWITLVFLQRRCEPFLFY